ncbi:Anthranilate phosphoribosyltransferase [Frigidibacter albus]
MTSDLAPTALAPFVRILGRGPGRSRNLTQGEAFEAMQIILSGRAAPEAVGALLMLMRFRGEGAGEIAGFATALRVTLPALPAVDLDWPSYAAGRSRGLPWFLLSARLVALTGARVLLHGWNSHQPDAADLRAALPFAGIAQAESATLAALLDRDGIAYLPLESFSPAAMHLLRLRDMLGLRSCINTVLRVLNPALAPAAVQGVFHPPYRPLQQQAAALMGQPRACIIKGGGGEFERSPAKDTLLFQLSGGLAEETTAAAIMDERLPGTATHPEALAALWAGTLTDPLATATVTGTAALALMTLGRAEDPEDALALAQSLWASRPLRHAA